MVSHTSKLARLYLRSALSSAVSRIRRFCNSDSVAVDTAAAAAAVGVSVLLLSGFFVCGGGGEGLRRRGTQTNVFKGDNAI